MSASANANCPGPPSARAGRVNSGAATRSAVVMNGLSAGLRQAMACRWPPLRSARRRLAKACTGWLKNITPKRETMRSRLAGANACCSASATVKSMDAPADRARSRATSIIGAEMSMPLQRPSGPSRSAMARHSAPVPQPTSSTCASGAAAMGSASTGTKPANMPSSSDCACTQASPAGPFQRSCWVGAVEVMGWIRWMGVVRVPPQP